MYMWIRDVKKQKKNKKNQKKQMAGKASYPKPQMESQFTD